MWSVTRECRGGTEEEGTESVVERGFVRGGRGGTGRQKASGAEDVEDPSQTELHEACVQRIK